MLINPKELVAGYPSLKIRKLFKVWECDYCTVPYIAKKMKISESATRKLIPSLIKLGYVKKAKREKGCWQLTETGLRYSQAKASYIKRETADKIVESMLKKVDEINKDESLDYCILYIIVFGSYLKKGSFVGDVDVSMEIRKKDKLFSQDYCSKSYDPKDKLKPELKESLYDILQQKHAWKNVIASSIRCNKKLEFHDHNDIVSCADNYKFLYLDPRMDEEKIREVFKGQMEEIKNGKFSLFR